MLSAGDRILSDKSRQMNRAQRAILLTVISIDVLLILFPPFEHARVVGSMRLGHHWIGSTDKTVQVALGSLALEILIVSMVALPALLFARTVPDEWTEKTLHRIGHLFHAALPWLIRISWSIFWLAVIAVLLAVVLAGIDPALFRAIIGRW